MHDKILKELEEIDEMLNGMSEAWIFSDNCTRKDMDELKQAVGEIDWK